jgi:hypothetical protein
MSMLINHVPLLYTNDKNEGHVAHPRTSQPRPVAIPLTPTAFFYASYFMYAAVRRPWF